jgi:autotransporter adhesin
LADTDAANVGQVGAQVQEAINTANTYTDASNRQTLQQSKDYTDWSVNQLRGELDDRFRDVNNRINRVGAVSMAAAGLEGGQAEDSLQMSLGGYRNASAVAIGLKHRFSDRVSVQGKFAASSGGEYGYSIGVNIDLSR